MSDDQSGFLELRECTHYEHFVTNQQTIDIVGMRTMPGPKVINFFSAEHKIQTAHKCRNSPNKLKFQV